LLFLGFRRVKPTSVNLESEPIAKPIAGVLIYRFDSALVFFNSHHFASRVRQVIREAKEKLSWFVLDSEAITLIDSSGHFGVARAKGWFLTMIERTGVAEKLGRDRFLGSVQAAVDAATQTKGTR